MPSCMSRSGTRVFCDRQVVLDVARAESGDVHDAIVIDDGERNTRQMQSPTLFVEHRIDRCEIGLLLLK